MGRIRSNSVRQIIVKNGGIVAAILTSFMVFVCANSVWMRSTDNLIVDKRFALLSKKIEADSVVIGIDSKSLLAFPEWPWSRDVHARLVDKLNEQGVSAIAFDIDFSAPNNRAGNHQFGKILEQSRAPVYLASFRQQLSENLPNIKTEILPHKDFRSSAQIASVDFVTENSGMIRRALDGNEFTFGMVPSFSYALMNKQPTGGFFYIDYAVAPESIDVVSYVDVLNGQVDASRIQGKKAFVGALAVELGDEYVIPNSGSVSGVVINALAYETVRLNRELRMVGVGPVLLLTVPLIFLLLSGRLRANRAIYFLVNIAVLGISITIPVEMQRSANIILPTAVLHFAQLMCVGWAIVFELERRARNAFRGQMAAKENHVLLQALVADNHEGILVVNRSGVIELVNSRAELLLNQTGCELVRKNLNEVEPRLVEGLDFEKVQAGENKKFILWGDVGECEDCSAIEVTVSRSFVARSNSRFERRTSDRIFVVFALHDLTEQKKLEKAERQAKETFAALSDAKTQLISNMSHELRTPLNSIIGFSDVLMSTPAELYGHDESKKYLSMINAGGRKLLLVLNDMLFASNIQAGNLDLVIDDLDVEEFFDSAITEAKGRDSWKNQQLTVTLDGDIIALRADFSAMKLALVHLLDNAAKFGGKDACIEVKTELLQDRAIISIRDDGPGCSPKALLNLGDMFGQESQTFNRSFEGCGLGLYLAKSIVRLHGGSLTLKSPERQGFSAIMTFPINGVVARTKAA